MSNYDYAAEFACYDRLPKSVQKFLRENDLDVRATEAEAVIACWGVREGLKQLAHYCEKYKKEHPILEARKA